jgi:hypothetical protein
MNGTKGTKNGSNKFKFPGIIDTFKECLGVIFLKDTSIITIYLNPAHALNLITIYFIMILIPYRPMMNEPIFDFSKIIEGILLTIFFIVLLYIFMPSKKIRFSGFFRIMLAAEVIDIINPVSFFVPKEFLSFFYAGSLGWYFLIVVIILNKFIGMPKHIGVIYVFCVFLVVNMIPALFQ